MSTSPAPEPPAGCDFAVVGGGIVGLAVARELAARRPGASLCVLEREPELASHQTGHSSGVIHAGIYYEPGSLKARLCVQGARELYAYCDERGIEARRDGKLIVAADERDLRGLDELERRGRANGVRGLRRVQAGEIAAIEPEARGLAALHSPETGVVDFRLVAEAFAADVREAGGAIVKGCAVRGLEADGTGIALTYAGGSVRARFAVLCAGAWSDRLAVAAGAPAEPRIVPFRGGYLRLRHERSELVRASIYPVPDPELPFLGAHLTRAIDQRVLLGPSALLVGGLRWPGTWRLMRRQWRTGLTEIRRAADRRSFVREAGRLVPGLSAADFTGGPSGVRAQAVNRDGSLVDDFVVHLTERALHVRNAPSPAATASLALSRLIVDEAEPELG